MTWVPNIPSIMYRLKTLYMYIAISQDPKKSQILGPNSLPLALVMDLHQKHYGQGRIKHRSINS